MVVAVAGEALTDLVPAGADGLFRAAPGGSPANVAVGLARLDVPVRLLARLGDDALGHRIREHLVANAVDLSRAVSAEEPSSLAIVTLGPDGGAEYDFRVDGTADWQWTDAELSGSLDGDVTALHVGSLALVLEPGGAALRRFARRAAHQVTVSFDPNVRPLLMGSRDGVLATVEELLSFADVVKVSAEDLAWLLPGATPQDVAQDWLGRGPAVVAVTMGADGVLGGSRVAGIIHRPAPEVQVVDTVGAGDSFTGALLAGLSRHDLLGAHRRGALRDIAAPVLAQVLDAAVEVAAITCSRLGADPPTSAEVGSFSDVW